LKPRLYIAVTVVLLAAIVAIAYQRRAARDEPIVDEPPGTDEQVARDLKSAFLKCYNPELARDPSTTGTLLVSLTISPQGTVTKSNAYLTEGTLSKPMIECVEAQGQKARFASRTTEQVARFPITFVKKK
jgi:hypothetical protein